jgi:hypothetical protein
MAVLRLTRILPRVALSLALLLAILWSAAAPWSVGNSRIGARTVHA